MTTSEQKVAVVTGAAGGLGRSIAAGLAQRGCRVVIADIDAKNGRATADALTAAGGEAVYLAVDLSTPTGPETMIAETMAAYGRIDVLVNNAGYGRGEGFAEMTAETWDRTYAINLRAVALAMRAAGAMMKAAGQGRIVNITSPASRMALPNYTAYSATKAALDSVTRAAAVALAPFGVRVNSVAPGMMDTPMQRDTEIAFAKLEGRSDIEKFLAERTARIPLGRRTDCDEVAAGAIWLALDAPDYIVAERLNLSGGLDRD